MRHPRRPAGAFEQGSGDHPVVEGQRAVGELLSGLVALARDHDDVPRLRQVQRHRDRPLPIELDDELGRRPGRDRLAGARRDGGEDPRRVLRARVVRRQHGDVGRGGRGAHGGALAAVAVPTRPEDDEDASTSAERAQRGDDLRDRFRGVRVVHQHRERLSTVDPLEPTGGTGTGGDASSGRGGRHARAHGGDERAGGVVEVEPAGQAGAQRDRVPVPAQRGTPTVHGQLDVDELDVGVRVGSDRGHRDPDQLQQTPRPRAVEEHHPPGSERREEQAGLGGEVGLHRAVPVEMVLGEVRVDRHGEAGAVDAAQVQPVRGDLHGHGVDPTRVHPSQQTLQIRALGGGAHARLGLAVDPRLDRADHPDPDARGGERRLEEVGGGGLAVGARDADDRQVAARVPVDGSRGRPHRGTDRWHLQLGDVEVEPAFDQQRRRALRHRRRCVVVTVGARTRDGAEQGAGADLPTVVGRVGDADVVSVSLGAAQRGGNLREGRAHRELLERWRRTGDSGLVVPAARRAGARAHTGSAAGPAGCA
jgi:hypothetical protein